MADWAEGYVADVDYLHACHATMAPTWLRFASLLAGVSVEVGDAPTYLELGCGQGVSLAVYAAANPGTYWGMDLLPSQVVNGRRLAAMMDSGPTILEASFAEMLERDDLPEMDMIALHGVWSWVSAENRQRIVALARRLLKPGGVLYVSHNTRPWWSPIEPMRSMLMTYMERECGGPVLDRVRAAARLVDDMAKADVPYIKRIPVVANWVNELKEKHPRYLVHEYFNEDWHPQTFAETATELEEAKVTFVTSAHVKAHIDPLHLTEPMREMLAGIHDPVMRETVREFCCRGCFRSDIFVKGPQRVGGARAVEMLGAWHVTLVGAPEDRPTTITGDLGEANLNEAVHGAVVTALADDEASPKRIGDLIDHPAVTPLARTSGERLAMVRSALLNLMATDFVSVCHDPETTARVQARTDGFNRALCAEAELGAAAPVLASPVTGQGVEIDAVDQVFLRALYLKHPDPVAFATGHLLRMRHPLVGPKADGATRSPVEVVRERYARFETRALPLWRRLGIV